MRALSKVTESLTHPNSVRTGSENTRARICASGPDFKDETCAVIECAFRQQCREEESRLLNPDCSRPRRYESQNVTQSPRHYFAAAFLRLGSDRPRIFYQAGLRRRLRSPEPEDVPSRPGRDDKPRPPMACGSR